MSKKILEIAGKHNASEIKLLVLEDERRARNLYQKLGFRRVSIPEVDELLVKEARMSKRRRIILAEDLKSR